MVCQYIKAGRPSQHCNWHNHNAFGNGRVSKKKLRLGNAHCKGCQGNIYFGTGFGQRKRRFGSNISRKIFIATTSSVYLRSFTVNQKPFRCLSGVNNLEELSLRYNQNTINIETGIIDYYAKGKGHLRYKLVEATEK